MGILASVRRGVSAWFGHGFEAGATSRRLKNFQPVAMHINTKLAQSGPTMLARARYLALNNGYANNAVEAWAGNCIGTGIIPSFQLSNRSTKKKLARLWKEWVEEADADGLTDFYGLQRRCAREMFIAGEVFVRFRTRRSTDGLSVPFQLQVLPSEMLPLNKTETASNGNEIRQGVEFDGIGRRVAYHFYRKHPGDYTNRMLTQETVRVPASEVVHLIDPVDGGQIRGVSRFAPAIVKLFLLDVYDDAELDRKKVAAMHALFVETETPEDWDPEDNDPEGTNIDLQPGMVAFLQPGEKVTTSSPADSGATYEPFQYRTLLQVSAATGIPYAILTNDMVKANYSNTRAALVEFRRRVEAFQFSVIVFQLCRPVLGRFLDIADLSGALRLPGFATRRKEYLGAKWLPPRWEWVDPWKDAKAEIEQIGAGLKSRTMAIAERGYDAEEVDEEIATDRDREQRLGLSFGQPAGAGGSPPIEGGPENGPGAAPGGSSASETI